MKIGNSREDFMNRFDKKLCQSVGGSFYGKPVWKGIHSTIEQAGAIGKLKTLAGTIFGTYLITATSYLSFDGAVRITKWSLEEALHGDALPSDIGHGGEWLQQPFQNLLIVHLLFISTLANEGRLSKVKRLYADFVKDIVERGKPSDLSEIYSRFERDFKFLAKRSYRSMNLFEIKIELIRLFRHIDTKTYQCPSLDIDRGLVDEYRSIAGKIQRLDNWNPKNVIENWRIGLYQLGKKGMGQAFEKSLYFTIFQIVMIVSSGLIIVGLASVIDEVFVSKRSEESVGHLSEWFFQVFANLFLIRYSYLIMIKREAMLVRTRRVMKRHLRNFKGNPQRLIKLMNQTLDCMAEKCHFTHLPSSYRFNPLS